MILVSDQGVILSGNGLQVVSYKIKIILVDRTCNYREPTLRLSLVLKPYTRKGGQGKKSRYL